MARGKSRHHWIWLVVLLLAVGCAKPVMFEQTGVELDADADDHFDDTYKMYARNVTNVPAGTVSSLTAQDAIDEISGDLTTHEGAADPHAGYLLESLFDAYSIVYATSDNTPARLTVGEQTVVGRATGGAVAALSIDSDLAATSASDDSLPSAKAAKTYTDDHADDPNLHNGLCDPTTGLCAVQFACNTLAVESWPAPAEDTEIRCYTNGGVDTLHYWSGSAWTAFGGFAFDTYPANSDSAHVSGIAVDGTTLAIYSATAGKWMTVSLTDSLSPATPTLTSRVIDTDGVTLTLTGSASLSVGAGGNGGFDVDCATAGNDITATYDSGLPGTDAVYTLGTTVNSGDTCDLDYTQPTNGIESTSGGVDLASITSGAITNNSVQSGGAASQTRVPTGTGAGGSWTASATTVYGDTDETPDSPNDTDYAYKADTAGYHYFTFTAFSISSSSIDNVTVNLRCRETVADSSIRGNLRVNGTNYVGSDKTLTESFTDQTAVWSTNPATGIAWTEAEVEGGGSYPMQQFAIESRGMAAGEEVQCSAVSITVNYQE